MTCDRCGGLSVAMHFDDDHTWEYDGWRCMNCGNVIDPLILTNRGMHANQGMRSMGLRGMRPARGEVGPGRPLRLDRS
jgi:hypothetical protein